MTEAFNIDCMDAMARMKDNEFDLAIVDPPYGAFDKMIKGGGDAKIMREEVSTWDIKPDKEYFNELQRISKNQIIWGANYFINELPLSSRWLCWDKGKLNHFPEFELAWMSLNKPSRMFRYHRVNAYINDMVVKIHPTQKPIKLYKWLLKNYAKEGDRILDTHLGSGSSRIAAYDMGFDFTGYEIDKDYFDAQEKRFNNHIKQGNLFEPKEMY